MSARFHPVAVAALMLFLLSSPLLADVVHLKNGGRVEGTVVAKGDSYEVTHRFGSVLVKKADVASIEKKDSLKDLHAKRRSEIDAKDPDQLVELGKWCRENGWEAQAVKEFKAALVLDPDHRTAHSALGHVYYEGAWRTERGIMELRGFVLVEGQWVTKEEAERLKTRVAEERRVKAFQRKLNRLFRRIARGTDKERQRAHDEVVTVAREIGDKNLEKFAGDVKAYYDAAWAIARRELAIMEIRATMATLKRPIQTFTTSLGAGSTPVSIQLPEIAIASIGTTAVVPVGR